VLAGALSFFAQRSERPSEIALFLGLVRIAVVAIALGALLTLFVGFWLVFEEDVSFSEAWLVLSLILWFVAIWAGQMGGSRDRQTRLLAEELAAGDDVATPELRARLSDTRTLALDYGSGVLLVVVLALMVWRPGA
jgi:uncharacterized membrane protein